jgi:drug/metabolite transporter (DMT)-like permease
MKSLFFNWKSNAYFFAILSVLLWSTAASAFKIALSYVPFQQLLLISCGTSCLYLYGILLIKKKFISFFKQDKSAYLHSALLGFLNPFLYYLILFKAYSLLPAQIAQPLNFIWPIITVFFSALLLKHNLTFRHIIALIISFLGVFIISTRGNLSGLHSNNPLGVFLALISSVVWALFFVLNVKDKRNAIQKLAWSFSFGFFYIFLYNLFIAAPLPHWKGIFAGVYVGLFEMGITFVCWLKALALTDSAAKVSNLIYLTPFLSLLVIRLVLHEQILPSSVIGLVFIILGIVYQNIGRKKKSL